MSYLWQITAPHFTAGFETTAEGDVIEAAPIIRYMNSWELGRVSRYCETKSWKIDGPYVVKGLKS